MVIARTVGGGDIAFLTGHAPFVGALDIGAVTDPADATATSWRRRPRRVRRGVGDNRVTILSDVAELADQIDVERARRAKDAGRARPRPTTTPRPTPRRSGRTCASPRPAGSRPVHDRRRRRRSSAGPEAPPRAMPVQQLPPHAAVVAPAIRTIVGRAVMVGRRSVRLGRWRAGGDGSESSCERPAPARLLDGDGARDERRGRRRGLDRRRPSWPRSPATATSTTLPDPLPEGEHGTLIRYQPDRRPRRRRGERVPDHVPLRERGRRSDRGHRDGAGPDDAGGRGRPPDPDDRPRDDRHRRRLCPVDRPRRAPSWR